jgi:hypothetical protein
MRAVITKSRPKVVSLESFNFVTGSIAAPALAPRLRDLEEASAASQTVIKVFASFFKKKTFCSCHSPSPRPAVAYTSPRGF